MDPMWGIVFGLIWTVGLWEGILHQFDHVAKFFRELKGSRTRYYLSPEGAVCSRSGIYYFKGSITGLNEIEIARGPFHFQRRRAIIGPTAKNWKITKISFDADTQGWFGKYFIELRGCSDSLPVEQALRLINSYPSLQAMLDQIANLEKELVHARFKVAERAAMLQALNLKLTADKQRFRGSPAKEIQANIQFALRETGEQHVYRQIVDVWLEKLKRPEANIFQ